jgi:hypothetical protein
MWYFPVLSTINTYITTLIFDVLQFALCSYLPLHLFVCVNNPTFLVPISELNPTAAFTITITCGVVHHLPQVKLSQ